jgi:MYXO-CTERM domain-containing protein
MHTVSAAAVDAAGNAGAPVTRDFTVDTGAPMVTITSPVAGQQVADTTPTVTGTAEPGAVVTIVIDGQVVGTATAGADGMWSFEVPALTPGTHTVEARTTDGAGNMGSSGSVSFEVKTQAPVVIVTPVMGGAVTGPTVVVTGTGEPGATITVTVGGQTKTAVVGQDGAWTVSFDAVPAGMTTIEAGDGSTSTSVTVTVNDPTDDTSSFVLTGTGGCAQGAGGSPASGALWLLALGAIARRRRR